MMSTFVIFFKNRINKIKINLLGLISSDIQLSIVKKPTIIFNLSINSDISQSNCIFQILEMTVSSQRIMRQLIKKIMRELQGKALLMTMDIFGGRLTLCIGLFLLRLLLSHILSCWLYV